MGRMTYCNRGPCRLEPTGDGQCLVYRWNWTGIFWKGDFGWTFKNRDVTFKRIADTC
jgi:hypothetical protein